MRQSEAWKLQIESDFGAAEWLRARAQTDSTMNCQAVSKYQQVVEKSVKAVVSAIDDLGVHFMTITSSHNPSKEIDALITLRRAIDNTSVKHITRMFSNKTRDAIHALCGLARKFPEPGQPFALNTEYPFEDGGSWTAPAASGVFTHAQVQETRELAWVLHRNALRFASAVRRGNL